MTAFQRASRKSAWWVEFVYRGVRRFERSPIQNRRGAEAHERKLRNDLDQTFGNGRPLAPTKAPRYVDYVDRWMRDDCSARNRPSTLKAKQHALKLHLVPALGALRLDQIREMEVASLVGELRRKGLSPKTTNNVLTMLRHSLTVAVDWGLLRAVPRISPLRTAEAPFRYLSEPEERALLAATPPGFWRAFVLLLLHTGLRFSEAAALQWSNVTLDGDQPFAHICRAGANGIPGPTKSGRVRDVPLSRPLIAELRRLPRVGDLVFPHKGARPIMSAASKTKYVYGFCQRAGIKRCAWHALRHTFGTRSAAIGVSIPLLQKLMGHSSLKMTMRYVHVDPASIYSAVSAIERAMPVPWAPVAAESRPDSQPSVEHALERAS